jgi:hypothetical protein
MWRMVTPIVAAAALMTAVVSAQSSIRQVLVDVKRPSGAAEVDLGVEDFELTEGGERREIVSAMMTRRPALVRAALTAFVTVCLTMARGSDVSSNGPLEVMERLAAVINEAYTNSPPVYQIEFAGAPLTGTQPTAPQVRVLREGLRLSVISTP